MCGFALLCLQCAETALVLSSTDWENVSYVLRWLQGARCEECLPSVRNSPAPAGAAWHPGWTHPALPWPASAHSESPLCAPCRQDLTTRLPSCPWAVFLSSLSTGGQSCLTPLESCQLSVRSTGGVSLSETGLCARRRWRCWAEFHSALLPLLTVHS